MEPERSELEMTAIAVGRGFCGAARAEVDRLGFVQGQDFRLEVAALVRAITESSVLALAAGAEGMGACWQIEGERSGLRHNGDGRVVVR